MNFDTAQQKINSEFLYSTKNSLKTLFGRLNYLVEIRRQQFVSEKINGIIDKELENNIQSVISIVQYEYQSTRSNIQFILDNKNAYYVLLQGESPVETIDNLIYLNNNVVGLYEDIFKDSTRELLKGKLTGNETNIEYNKKLVSEWRKYGKKK